MTDPASSDAESLFERALVTSDEAYLMAESLLRDAPESAPVLARSLQHPDPIGRLLARVMLEWAQDESADFDAVTRYLDKLERRFAPTVARTPPVTGVIDNLTRRFGGRLAEFLALRLVQQTQPDWRVMMTLGYLDRHKNPATTSALIRFATQTRVPRYQQVAARVIADLGDPALAQKLRTERERLAAHGATLPPVLASLPTVPSAVA